jgi:hypothetical protein
MFSAENEKFNRIQKLDLLGKAEGLLKLLASEQNVSNI